MGKRILGLLLLAGLLVIGCGEKADPNKGNPPQPPSKEITPKGGKGKMVLDEFPPPPVTKKP